MTTFPAVLAKQERAANPRWVSLGAYFRAEEKAFEKSEYHAGKTIKMAGANLTHNRLAVWIAALIYNFIEEKDLSFFVSNSDTKIRIEVLDKVVYPVAVVVCEPPVFFEKRQDTILNPILVVEVLSKSTSKHDRTLKFDDYRTIPSFKEYVLVYQESKFVVVYSKQADGSWIFREYSGEEATAVLFTIRECPIELKRLYRGLDI